MGMESPIFLYDGVCGLCNRMVQFILRHDAKEIFRFAALQSELAGGVLARHGENAADLDTVYVVVNGGSDSESLLKRSEAVIFVLRELGGVWPIAAWILRCFPGRVRDWLYGLMARYRYRVFGRYDVCARPEERVRQRFIDL